MIPVYQPDLSGREREYLLDAFDSSWISSKGSYIDRFERALADITGIDRVAVVSNGTVALHLALHCLGIGPGDEVIVPSFTYIASVNTIAQTGATPVFVDVQRSDWLVDPALVAAAVTVRTKAIMAVHLYSGACDVSALRRIADENRLYLIEDCAEALGTTVDGRHVGFLGDVGTLSFFGNKTVTTGEGGAVMTRDPDLYDRMVRVKGQGQDPSRRYWHTELGFNYRMTNLCAAIGLAQAERLAGILGRKRQLARRYRDNLQKVGVEFQRPREGVISSEWLVTGLLPEGVDRDAVMERLHAAGIETRPAFYCAHHMPPYFSERLELPVSEAVAVRGISFPSYQALSDDEIDRVCQETASAIAAVSTGAVLRKRAT